MCRMGYDSSKIAFLDTETLGLDPEQDQIWEVAVIVDGVEHVWQHVIPHWHDSGIPGVPPMKDVLDPWIVENTGILDRYDHDTAIPASDGIHRLIDLVDGRHIVGACPWFDLRRLHDLQLFHDGTPSDMGRLERWHYHYIDVENLAVGYLTAQYQMLVDYNGDPGHAAKAYYAAALPWKSTDLSRALGVNPDNFQPKHTALADARWAKAMYEAMFGDPI